MASEAHVELRDVTLCRGDFTLTIPHWRVAPGRVVGVVGPNGAGKTTLLELLGGFLAPDTGTVRVIGLDPIDVPERVFAQLGYATDSMPVLSMPIGKLLELIAGYYESWDHDLAKALLEQFRLRASDQATELSKGQATGLRLVLAMAFRPRILVLDEPGTGLDLGNRQRMLHSVLEVINDPERSVIISSHQLHDVQRISDELLVLNEGQIVQQGPIAELVPDSCSLEEAMVAWGAQG